MNNKRITKTMCKIIGIFICFTLLSPQIVYGATNKIDRKAAIIMIRDAMVERKDEVLIPHDMAIFQGPDLVEEAMSEEYAINSSTGDYLYYSCWDRECDFKEINGEVYHRYKFYYTSTKAEEQATNKFVAKKLKSLGAKSGSEYNRVYKIYNWMVNNIDYDDSQKELSHSAYSATKSSTVCQGFATLFYKMCKEAGVNVRIIGNYEHIWNVVCIDGKWYNIDATADQSLSELGCNWACFLVCDKHLGTHETLNDRCQKIKNDLNMASKCYSELQKDYYPQTTNLSTTNYTYNGKTKKPSVTVKNSKGKTIASSNYTITYPSGRKAVGKYTVKIKFKGIYSGTVSKTFTIKPKATSVSNVTSGRKKFTVKWKKLTKQTTGYQIQYSTSSKFTNAKTITVSKNKTTSKTISKLKAKKKYYVRVRTYKTVKVNEKSTKIYSSWSKAKVITTKN